MAAHGLTRRSALLFAAMCVIWGIPYLLIRVAVRDLSPSMLVLSRTALAALLLLPLAAARGELRPVLRYWPALLAFAAVEIAIPWVLLAAAEQRVSSSLTGLLIAAVPLVGVAIAWRTGGRERPGAASAAGLLLGIVGLDVHGVSALALVEIAAVAVCYAVGPVILQRGLAHLPALGVIALALGATALVYLPAAFFDAPDHWPRASVDLSVVTLAVVCTAVAFVFFFALIAEIGPVRATVITYVNPAVAAVLGVAILGERFTLGMGVGFALVLAGSILATRPARPARVPEPEALEAIPS
jgi:drug/metabolite transporter (DMT)-like permease